MIGDDKKVSGNGQMPGMFCSASSESNTGKSDTKCDYLSDAVKIALDLAGDVKLQQDIDRDTFYELQRPTRSSMCGDDIKAKLYSSLVTHGLLGEHSGDITRDEKIKLLVKC